MNKHKASTANMNIHGKELDITELYAEITYLIYF